MRRHFFLPHGKGLFKHKIHHLVHHHAHAHSRHPPTHTRSHHRAHGGAMSKKDIGSFRTVGEGKRHIKPLRFKM